MFKEQTSPTAEPEAIPKGVAAKKTPQEYDMPYSVDQNGQVEMLDPKKPFKIEERDLNAEK